LTYHYQRKSYPSEKILSEIRLNLTFHSENAECDPKNFNMLKMLSISCLNSEGCSGVITVGKKARFFKRLKFQQPMFKRGKYGEIRLKVKHFQ
jgi:hypothetical protein